jgi:succinyl-diaminopimelate desuccinylase
MPFLADTSLTDPLPLAQALIRCPSVTPKDAGALGVLEQALAHMGFATHRLIFTDSDTPDIANLYGRMGTHGPTLCFAGHTDVVPPGTGWSQDPFAATVVDGVLYGRGANDMKTAIAAFVAAVAREKQAHDGPLPGSIALLITGDEEGPAINGTVKMLSWLRDQGETLDACVVGEPTNPMALGDMIKIGRRGSLNGRLTAWGSQGHVAYPDRADNPIPRLMTLLQALTAEPLDAGNAHFQASNLEITSVDVGNSATNVIPGKAEAMFNVRFNSDWSGASLEQHLRHLLASACPDTGLWDLQVSISGESFLTQPGPFVDLLASAVADVTGRQPELSTSGGTSDARFIKDVCPVVEFGLVGQTMHKANECCRIEDLEALTAIYQRVIAGFFALESGAMTAP